MDEQPGGLSPEERRLLEEHRKGLKQSAQDAKVTDVLLQGLETDGAHHKQWALWKVGELLGLSHFLNDIEDRGIAP